MEIQNLSVNISRIQASVSRKEKSAAKTPATDTFDIYVDDLRGASEATVSAHVDKVVQPAGAVASDPSGLFVRRIVIVSSQQSDELALSCAPFGIMFLEGRDDEPRDDLLKAYLEGLGFVHPSKPLQRVARHGEDEPGGELPGSPSQVARHFAYTREPSYFNAERYDDWLERLAQPWNEEADRDTET